MLGVSPKSTRWLPEASQRLLVMSPFVGAAALEALATTSKAPVALISRLEELDALEPGALRSFSRTYVLDDAAEVEDGEDTSLETTSKTPRGLHAKLYVAEHRSDAHVYLGSANATDGALLAGKNLELMVELVGKTRDRGIDALLSNHGLGAMLSSYEPPPEPALVDAAVEEAERALSEAGCALAEAKLQLAFMPQGSAYLPTLSPASVVALPRIAGMRAWLVTTDESSARDAAPLARGAAVELASCTPASATGLVAFELTAEHPGVRSRFTLNIPVERMPPDRDGHITRLIVSNRERLLTYLLNLLDLDATLLGGLDEHVKLGGGLWGGAASSGAGLLERLVRARAREPQRLADFQQVIDALLETPEGRELVPPDLLQVWAAVKPEQAPP